MGSRGVAARHGQPEAAACRSASYDGQRSRFACLWFFILSDAATTYTPCVGSMFHTTYALPQRRCDVCRRTLPSGQCLIVDQPQEPERRIVHSEHWPRDTGT